MRQGRFAEAQIVVVLKDTESYATVADDAPIVGMSATFRNWRAGTTACLGAAACMATRMGTGDLSVLGKMSHDYFVKGAYDLEMGNRPSQREALARVWWGRCGKLLRLVAMVVSLLPVSVQCASADSISPQCPESLIQEPDSNQCVAPDSSTGDPIRLYIPDGQLRSSPVRLFVNRNISMNDKPIVCFYSGHALTAHKAAEDRAQQIDYVAPGQSWTENVNGQDVTKSGTVVLLNVSGYPIEWYKPMKRVLAVVQWQDDGKRLCAVAERPVNLGNAPTAWGWTIIVGTLTLACIIALALYGSGSVITLLCADDGHLSLSLTQIALWTIAVGAVTFFYGMIRFEVPTIPNSVLILMGMSLATAGLGIAAPPQTSPQGAQPATAGDAAPAPTNTKAAKLSDLIYLFPKEGTPQPSLSRAQMLFWTMVIIVLFLAKSAIDGVLWDVPSGMVALMGLSQAGYVGPKFLGPYAGSR
jgi:hypothetical protein